MDEGHGHRHSDNKLNKINGHILRYLYAAASPPLTETEQSAYIAEHGENEDEPVLDFAYRRGRGRPVEEMNRRRNKKRNAARKKRVKKEARGEDEVEGEAGDEDGESGFAGLPDNHGHVDGYEEGGPLPIRNKRTSLLDISEQTVRYSRNARR
ncbi:hypothetical protein D6D06_06883 [Aureobasidium pullulans]|nr:hypothetical protein D6D06_06883 [Aureobasidium pullulans]THX80999.1 hypothetical protein D6D05_04318 [Aureobasidium pullulans]